MSYKSIPILKSGKVGINNTNPQYQLDISGTLNLTNNSTINNIYTSGNFTGYQQINIQNLSNGNLASSDLVATADVGNENNYYVDLGINSSTYTGQFVGGSGDSYLYNAGNDFYIANTTSGRNLYLSAGNVPYSEQCKSI